MKNYLECIEQDVKVNPDVNQDVADQDVDQVIMQDTVKQQ